MGQRTHAGRHGGGGMLPFRVDTSIGSAGTACRIARARSVRGARGFTLMELMVTVVIVGILAAIAYPSYSRYVIRSNRSAAQSFILGIANQQEQFNLDARQYASSMTALGATTIPAAVSNNYTVTLTANNAATPPTYTVTAAPIGTQLAGDTQCLNLTVDQTGTKGISGPGPLTSCW